MFIFSRYAIKRSFKDDKLDSLYFTREQKKEKLCMCATYIYRGGKERWHQRGIIKKLFSP